MSRGRWKIGDESCQVDYSVEARYGWDLLLARTEKEMSTRQDPLTLYKGLGPTYNEDDSYSVIDFNRRGQMTTLLLFLFDDALEDDLLHHPGGEFLLLRGWMLPQELFAECSSLQFTQKSQLERRGQVSPGN